MRQGVGPECYPGDLTPKGINEEMIRRREASESGPASETRGSPRAVATTPALARRAEYGSDEDGEDTPVAMDLEGPASADGQKE